VRDYILPGLLGVAFMVASIMFAQAEGEVVEPDIAPAMFQPLEITQNEQTQPDTIAMVLPDEDDLIQASFVSCGETDEENAAPAVEVPCISAK
jgi:hypothetical protein